MNERKMLKKTATNVFKVPYNGTTIQGLINKLTEIGLQHGFNAKITKNCQFYYNESYDVKYERLENDEEYFKRIKKEEETLAKSLLTKERLLEKQRREIEETEEKLRRLREMVNNSSSMDVYC